MYFIRTFRIFHLITSLLLISAFTSTNAGQSMNSPSSVKDLLVNHAVLGFSCVPVFNCIGYNYGIERCNQPGGRDRCVACSNNTISTRNIKHSAYQGEIPRSFTCQEKSKAIALRDDSCRRTRVDDVIMGTEYLTTKSRVYCLSPCICSLDKCYSGGSACTCNSVEECPENYEMDQNGSCLPCRTNLGFYRPGSGCQGCMMNTTFLESIVGNETTPFKNNVLSIVDVNSLGVSRIARGMINYFQELRNDSKYHQRVGGKMVTEPTSIKLDFVIKLLDTSLCKNSAANNSIFIFVKDTPMCGDRVCSNNKYTKMFPFGFPDVVKKSRFEYSEQDRNMMAHSNDPISSFIADEPESDDGDIFQGFYYFDLEKCPVVFAGEAERRKDRYKTRFFTMTVSTEFGPDDIMEQVRDDKKLSNKLKNNVLAMINQINDGFEAPHDSEPTKLTHKVYLVKNSRLDRRPMTLDTASYSGH